MRPPRKCQWSEQDLVDRCNLRTPERPVPEPEPVLLPIPEVIRFDQISKWRNELGRDDWFDWQRSAIAKLAAPTKSSVTIPPHTLDFVTIALTIKQEVERQAVLNDDSPSTTGARIFEVWSDELSRTLSLEGLFANSREADTLIVTDGSGTRNLPSGVRSFGGAAAIVIRRYSIKVILLASKNTTSGEMEMAATYEAVELVTRRISATVVVDLSDYECWTKADLECLRATEFRSISHDRIWRGAVDSLLCWSNGSRAARRLFTRRHTSSHMECLSDWGQNLNEDLPRSLRIS